MKRVLKAHKTWVIQIRKSIFGKDGEPGKTTMAFIKVKIEGDEITQKFVNKWEATTFRSEEKAKEAIKKLCEAGFDKRSNMKICYLIYPGPDEIL